MATAYRPVSSFQPNLYKPILGRAKLEAGEFALPPSSDHAESCVSLVHSIRVRLWGQTFLVRHSSHRPTWPGVTLCRGNSTCI